MKLPERIEVFADRLDISDGHLHILTAAGIGDLAWCVSKLWSVCDQRKVTWWFPEDEPHRAGELAQLYGYKYGYIPNLSSRMAWEYAEENGEPDIPDTGGVIIISPNRHLEAGKRIERWFPDLPFKNPAPTSTAQSYRLAVGHGSYVIVFMGNKTYMEGNLMPEQWARALKMTEIDFAPVLCVAHGPNSQAFLGEVSRYYLPSLPPILGHSLSETLPYIKGARACMGTASGYTILSTYMGIPTVHAYPRWLKHEPGTWEQEGHCSDWCHVGELENAIREGFLLETVSSAERRRFGMDAPDQEQLPVMDDTQSEVHLGGEAGTMVAEPSDDAARLFIDG